jgi:hypothetical protein
MPHSENDVINLTNALKAWGSPGFESALKEEIQALDAAALPLQQGLAQSSHVGNEAFSPVIISIQEALDRILVKTGIFYSGIIAGSCCADDPTPVCEQTEYCELLLEIDKASGDTRITLV